MEKFVRLISAEKRKAPVHYSYKTSKKKAMLPDIQSLKEALCLKRIRYKFEKKVIALVLKKGCNKDNPKLPVAWSSHKPIGSHKV